MTFKRSIVTVYIETLKPTDSNAKAQELSLEWFKKLFRIVIKIGILSYPLKGQYLIYFGLLISERRLSILLISLSMEICSSPRR